MPEPIGSTLAPLGFFFPPSSLAAPSPLLADNVDPVTRDFRSLEIGVDPTDDQVQVTVMTTLGSGASVLNIGLRLSKRRLTRDAPQALEGDIRQALVGMTRARDIAFKRISIGTDTGNGEPSGEVDESNQALQMNVEYLNLRALDPRIRRVPLGPQQQLQIITTPGVG